MLENCEVSATVQAIYFSVIAKRESDKFTEEKLNVISVDDFSFFKPHSKSSERADLITSNFVPEICFLDLIFPVEKRFRQAICKDDFDDFETLFKEVVLVLWYIKDWEYDIKILESLAGNTKDAKLNHMLSVFAQVILMRKRNTQNAVTASVGEPLVKKARREEFDMDMLAETLNKIRIGSTPLLEMINRGVTVGEVIDEMNLYHIFPPECTQRKLIGRGVHIELKLKYMPKKIITHFCACIYFTDEQVVCVRKHILYHLILLPANALGMELETEINLNREQRSMSLRGNTIEITPSVERSANQAIDELRDREARKNTLSP